MSMETCMYFYDFQHPPYRSTVLIRDLGAYNLSAKSYEINLIDARKLEKGETGRTAPVQIGGRHIQPCSREFKRQMVQPWRRCGEELLVAISCLTLAERRSTNGTSVLSKPPRNVSVAILRSCLTFQSSRRSCHAYASQRW